MQREDDRPPSSGRPSLLSQAPQAKQAQQADMGRASVFDGLERRPAAAAPAAKRARKPLMLAGAAGILLFAAGVGIWLAAEPEPALTLAAAPAAPVSHPAAAPAATATSAAAVPGSEAPAATIVEETAAVSPPGDSRSLKEVLNDIPPKAPRAELTAALEKPHKPEPKKTEKAAQKPVQVAKKTDVKPKPKAAPPDSDVTLLAALMTHVQAAKTPSKEPSTPAYQLKQCGRMNEAGAAQCRAHLCATIASKEPECKQPAAVKTAAES